MRGIWEAGGGRPIDGVITGDPSLMAAFLEVVGTVDAPVWPETITADNVAQIVGADVYKTTSQQQSDEWEVGIGASLWDAVLSRPWPLREMATAMSAAIDGHHLQVWSANGGEQAALGPLGVTGAFVPPTDSEPRVTLNGFSANRAGYFASTDATVSSGPDDRGSLLTTVAVTVTSSAPTRPPSILLGSKPGDVGGKSLGTFATDINVYIPHDSTVESFRVDGREVTPFEWNELGAHGVSWPAFIEPGKSVTIALSYRPTTG
jgi:hypothetical protein